MDPEARSSSANFVRGWAKVKLASSAAPSAGPTRSLGGTTTSGRSPNRTTPRLPTSRTEKASLREATARKDIS